MHIALYARVSTRDKDQNPETQLLPLREYAGHRPTDTITEHVNHASATDLKHRTAWYRLLEAARLYQIDGIIVWRMDRAFRSALHAAQALGRRPEEPAGGAVGHDEPHGGNDV